MLTPELEQWLQDLERKNEADARARYNEPSIDELNQRFSGWIRDLLKAVRTILEA